MKQPHHQYHLIAWCFFLIVFLGTSITSLRIHQDRGILNWRSEIWADKAGYYMYLPAFFLHGFDAMKFPDKIDEKTGWGFLVDRKNNRIVTQYYYGVSLMVSPFFLGTHLVSAATGHDEMGGFSEWYHRAVNIAGAFYLTLGLFFLKRFLRHYISEGMQYFILISTFLGTNLFYYTVEDGLMSHVYSFFAVSLFLFAMKEFLLDRTKYGYFLLIVFALGLILAIRPVNILVAFLYPFWDAVDRKEMVNRVTMMFKPAYILPLIIVLLLFFFPQMLYWKHTHGDWIYLKYGEKFVNWNHPKVLQVWFSTLNGLFPWSPLVLFFVSGMFVMIFNKMRNGLVILGLFILITYMAAAYRYWHFGCGYGHRAFVEFYPVFCIPFGFLAVRIFSGKVRILKAAFVFVVVFSLYINTGLALTADKCFFGSTWDWGRYSMMLRRIHLLPEASPPFVYKNDFENSSLFGSNFVTDSIGNSGQWSTMLDANHEICCQHTAHIWDFRGAFPEMVAVEVAIRKAGPGPVGALLVCSFEGADTVFSIQVQPLDPFLKKEHEWVNTRKEFPVPKGLPGDASIIVSIRNPGKQQFFVDDLVIIYERPE